ncbi:MAG: hypothetical protein Q7S33_01120 [Nanoarchaeota archaeon]|nr:hypothetical protein [Nanoarchaeota archaeon]
MAKRKEKLFLIAGGAIFVFVIITSLLIIIQVPYNVKVIYTDKEPYTDTNCNSINLKSVVDWGQTQTVCLNQICDSHQSVCTNTNWYGGCTSYSDQCTHYACTKYRYYCSLNIQNIDDTAGTWRVNAYQQDQDTKQNSFVKDVDVFIQPTRTGTANWDFTVDAGNNVICMYLYNGINAPTKRVCKDVIAYNSIQKSKTEIRYCNAWKKLVGKCNDITEYSGAN